MRQHIDDNAMDSSRVIASELGSEPKTFTLKILFGPMFGCELSLPADDYFILIQPALAGSASDWDTRKKLEHTAAFVHSTLYFPCDVASPNLILRLKNKHDDEQGVGYHIDIHDSNGCDTQIVEENTLFRHQHICLAFKESHAAWDDSITGYNRTLPVSPRNRDETHITAFNSHKRKALVCAGMLLMLLLGGAGIAWYKHQKYENQVVALNVSLAGAPAPLKIVRARNNTLYVFGNGHQEMVWLREVLYKLNDTTHIIPVMTTQAKKEIVKFMQKKGYPALQLDLSTPQHPQLSTYERLSNAQESALKHALLQEMPYAENIDIVFQNKETLLKQAQQGLERLHIPYRQINTDSGYALIVRDALSDNTLSTLREFITDFYSRWGNQVINFSINLNENWLQDKSYLDAQEGYFFIDPLHWYFPQQLISQQQFPHQSIHQQSIYPQQGNA